MTSQYASMPQAGDIDISVDSILWLRERFGWMGNHSGYDQLCQAVQNSRDCNHINVWRSKRTSKVTARLLQWTYRYAKPSPFYNADSIAAELYTIWQSLQKKPSLLHVTYVENQLGILPNLGTNVSSKLVGTCHQPSSWWRLKHHNADAVSALDAVIVLSKREVAYFEEFLGKQVYFIPHGVDTDFFHPSPAATQLNNPRFVFSGSWLRDLRTLASVIDRVLSKDPAIGFDMVVPLSKRNSENFYRIARHPQVTWHSGVSDVQLRQLYQNASGLVLPLIDCTANNALVESIACGVPIISNDVGGLRDYTDPSFATLLPQGDVDGFAEEIINLANSPNVRAEKGNKARQFAEHKLAWSHIARSTFELYTRLSLSN